MAPSRRKGAIKAAAAAAARRKWKVGDLVLAKVKGFPAWPATVSEPEKWGYPADWKKVVVHFFGTEQIAFCNPVDIEEFTEEKKVSLLGKRHGKGADFVRAVKEIIDCFEKLKKQGQVSRADGTEETNITRENNPQESLTASVKDEAPAVTVNPLSAGTTNDLDSLTEAAVAAAAEDALQNEEMQLVEVPSNLVSTETPLSATYLTRNKTDVARSQNSGSQRRKPVRRLRSSSRIDASRLRSITVPSINNNRTSRRSRANASEDRSLRRSRRKYKSSDDSEGQDVDSIAFAANGIIEESDSGMMSVDSDTLSINDGNTVDSVSKPVGADEPFAEKNEGETELSDRLDFQSNNVIKKKRKPNRKRHNNDTVEVAKLDIVPSDAEMPKTECVSPSFSEKSAQKYAKDEGDEHLPLVKRARVRMGRPSPSVEEEVTLAHNEEKMSEVPESLPVQSSEPLSCKVDAPANRESVPIKEDPSLSSLSQASPANRPNIWGTRKNFVDGEAALPPSKRLHRALEAMSANVAEDCQRASNCSSAVNIHSNGHCPSSSLECSEMSTGKQAVIESGSGAVEHLSNGDSLQSASELCFVSNVERSENGAETIAVKSKNAFRFAEVPAEIDAEHHVKLDSVNVGDELANNTPGSAMLPTDHCKTECTELNEAAKGSDPDILQIRSDSTFVQDSAGGSPDIGSCTRLESADGEGDEAHKTKHLLLVENNQDSKTSEFVEEARPASLTSKIILPVTPVKVLNNKNRQSLLHSTSVSYDHMEDRTVSVTQSSSSLSDGPGSVARASPPSFSICNTSALDNNRSHENNSSFCPDVQLHLEKAKFSCKSSSKRESLSSFEAIIKSLTRTKESIGRATRIAIDCAKLGFATKTSSPYVSATCPYSSSSIADDSEKCLHGDLCGDGGVYPSAIQALLPRLLLAAAPPGSSSRENHRQCLKVLRVWQERKILPEPIICHHIRELDALCGSYPTIGSNRTLRNERAIDDPIREMEGMLVDEYGSNSSIQLPGFCMPPMLRDDDVESDSDGESFEAVTPEHNVDHLDGEKTLIPAVEKRSHILEDVDGELEMEDVAPCCEDEITSTSNIAGADQTQMSHQQPDNNYGVPFTTQQPKDVPLTSAPLLSSPPPPPQPLPPSAFPPAVLNSVSNGPDSKPYSSSQVSFCPGFVTILTMIAAALVHENTDFETEAPRHMPDSTSAACFNDRPTSRLSARASNSIQPNDASSKSFHLRPPHPAPSNQFSYVQERVQSRRDIPPHSRPNRFHTRNSDNGNFYRDFRDRDRNKFVQRDNIGEGWRPPFPSVSGPCYPDDARMANAPMSYGGPPREPPLPHNRWNFPSRPMNHRHFNPYRPPSEGPIPVANRDPGFGSFFVVAGQLGDGGRFAERWCWDVAVVGFILWSEVLETKMIYLRAVMGYASGLRPLRAWQDCKGNDVNLNTYKGKVLLVVNVASKCGFTQQNYTQMTELYSKYKDKGLEILAFPCNQFLYQEPGSSHDAEQFACTRFKAEYPIFQKFDEGHGETSRLSLR
ncbi:hypothetical protein DH2020_001579 [Rehmannia glutinosa]|uniref:Glutathione peroxidase n=1 Tax=Rehmannia glutinosa TaxID=99300 RepID=A0ABR0Y086_REHGL